MNLYNRTAAFVDLDQLTKNYQILQAIVGKTCHVMAVVKANAYGHGADAISRHLSAQGVRYFGVASLLEAIELRKAKIPGTILIFGKANPEEVEMLFKYSLTQTITSLNEAMALSDSARKLKVHINIDTGMSRFGMPCHQIIDIEQVASEIQQISALKTIAIDGIYTHFSEAENPDPTFTNHQFFIFKQLLERLETYQVAVGIRHVANSSATISYPNMHFDMVRVGIALYGLPHVPTAAALIPVLTLKTKVTAIRSISAGDSVSYGRTFIANKPMRIATLAIGYAEGYFRILSNRDYVLFQNHKCPVIGTVCMDAMMIDVTDVAIQINDEVEIFGINKRASEVADQAGTIDYEVLTNLSRRVERIYGKKENGHG